MTAKRDGNTALADCVLIVDDDVNLSRLLRTILRSSGYRVLTASSGEDALALLAEEPVDLVVLDLRMPGMDGRTVYREMRSRNIEAPVMIASAFGARAAQLELGAQAAIEKPFDPDRLVAAVRRVLGGS
jgi:DNA-binding response OmpR family regulator